MAALPYHDHFFRRAKQEGYLSRAVYKLIEIDRKYKLIRHGMHILDLGAAPGSWLQWTSSRIGPSGIVVGVDIQPINHRFPENVFILQKDVTEPEFVHNLIDRWGQFDLILSDMAPSTTGNKHTDAARSALLVEQAIFIARLSLAQGGNFLAKIFQGGDFPAILSELRKDFQMVKTVKPNASKKESKEAYLLGMKKVK